MITDQEALADVLACLRAEYAADMATGLRVVAQPGQTAIQDWCRASCGMAYVRVDGIGPSTQRFPNLDTEPSGVTSPQALTLHVGIARCVATLDAQGNPPPEDVQTAEAELFLDDARRIRRALRCCIPGVRRSQLLGRWTPLGPEGGCAGGYWPFTVRVK